MTPQQLRQLERFLKPNPKYTNTTIIEEKVQEPKTYEETSQNSACQKALSKIKLGN